VVVVGVGVGLAVPKQAGCISIMDEAIAKAGFCLALLSILVQQSNSPIESPGQWRNDGVFVTA
jgi:hypothetical protein